MLCFGQQPFSSVHKSHKHVRERFCWIQQEQGVILSQMYLLCFTFAAYGELCQIWQWLCIFLSWPQLGCLLENTVTALFTAADHVMHMSNRHSLWELQTQKLLPGRFVCAWCEHTQSFVQLYGGNTTSQIQLFLLLVKRKALGMIGMVCLTLPGESKGRVSYTISQHSSWTNSCIPRKQFTS